MEEQTSAATAALGYTSGHPGGFWIRVVAYIIDSIPMVVMASAICAVIGLPTFFDIMSMEPGVVLPGLYKAAGVSLLISTIYFVLLETSSLQASIGKKILGLKVNTMKGKRIGILNALLRTIPKLLLIAIFPLALIVVGMNSDKRGIHDFMAGTRVDKP